MIFDFLMKNNGGKPDINVVNVDNFGQININNFFGIDLKKNENDLEYCYSKYKNRIPVGCLPIADAEGGNIICISLSKDFGSIYFWITKWKQMKERNLIFLICIKFQIRLQFF
jgi:hypothetical protein